MLRKKAKRKKRVSCVLQVVIFLFSVICVVFNKQVLSSSYRTVVLSVTLVYCGQTVRRIKMKLGMQIGLGPGHIVLDGDSGPPP